VFCANQFLFFGLFICVGTCLCGLPPVISESEVVKFEIIKSIDFGYSYVVRLGLL